MTINYKSNPSDKEAILLARQYENIPAKCFRASHKAIWIPELRYQLGIIERMEASVATPTPASLLLLKREYAILKIQLATAYQYVVRLTLQGSINQPKR